MPSYESNEFEMVLDNGRKKDTMNITMVIIANGSYHAGEF
jgi:hypothetical protein